MPKSAEDMGKTQREISVSEFFEKNKHLLGFDNPTKALLIIVKEAVDNSLDACEEAGILPEITVNITQKDDDIYRIKIKDNGPGIVKKQVPYVFGKLLYGSKFHTNKQNRGQQGIGISACLLYSQLTTGKETIVKTKTKDQEKTHSFHLLIDTEKNEPKIVKEEELDRGITDHGISINMEAVANYRRTQGVEQYLRQTAIANPFAKITYKTPEGEKITYNRAVDKLPKPSKKIKPHPHGVELGILMRMAETTGSRTIGTFLRNDFSSTGKTSAEKICNLAKVDPKMSIDEMGRKEAEKLIKAMQRVNLQSPPLDCLSPIGENALKERLENMFSDANFIETVTRRPAVYRGNPFQIEVGLVYDPENLDKDKKSKLMRFANRVPLLYQKGACAIYKAASETTWKRYGLKQNNKSLPIGPVIIVLHISSVWVPFISESKEAIASYPDIVKEMSLALQSCGRKLKTHLNKRKKAKKEKKRLHIFEDYFPLIEKAAKSLAEEKGKVDIKPVMEKVVKKDLVKEDE